MNVEGELKARLPAQIAPLAWPLAGALHNLAPEAAQKALESPHVQEVWKQANRAADQSFVTIVNGGKGAAATGMLSEIAGAFIIIGIPLIAAAWLAGPARIATRARERIAPFLHDRADWTYGIVAMIMLLIFIWQPIPATGKPAGIIIFLALAFLGTYLLRRQTAEEFPEA